MKPYHKRLSLLHKKTWKLYSEYVRRTENGICYTCGVSRHWKDMDAGHYIHLDALDFDPINIHCQCTRCNRFLHGNLGVYAERLMIEYGFDVVDRLRRRANIIKRFNLGELEMLYKSYKTAVGELNEGCN